MLHRKTVPAKDGPAPGAASTASAAAVAQPAARRLIDSAPGIIYAGEMTTPSTPPGRPEPPVAPELEDCCRSGCTPCIFDLYEDALERYRRALAAWEAAHG